MTLLKTIVVGLALAFAGIVHANGLANGLVAGLRDQSSVTKASCPASGTASPSDCCKEGCGKEGSACKADGGCCVSGSSCCASSCCGSDCCKPGASCCASDGKSCKANGDSSGNNACCSAKKNGK